MNNRPTDNVVELNAFKPKKPLLVHECACGCQLFYLVAGGDLECRGCAHTLQYKKWQQLEVPPAKPAT